MQNFDKELKVAIQRLPNFVKDKSVSYSWQPQPTRSDLLYPNLVNEILSTLHHVYFELGPGFLHQVYRRATMVELQHFAIFYSVWYVSPCYRSRER